jgi:hypothetical protein
MSEGLGSQVIVENKPGASTAIGARDVMGSPPDGHTLLYTIAIHVQLPHLYKTPPWDAFRDFTPITAGARAATVLTAHTSMPFGTVQELVAYAKANPLFVFKAGIVEGRVVNIGDIANIAAMPSKEELIAKLLFLINSPAQRIAIALNGVARNLAVVIGQAVEKKKFQE